MKDAVSVIFQALKDAWEDMWTALACNLIWLLAQFLILPGPPATLALFDYTNRVANGEAADLGDFWRSFTRHWGTAWRWGLLNDGVIALLLGDYYLTGRLSHGLLAHFIQGFYLAALAIWFVLQLYLLPLLFEQEKPSVRLALRNGAAMLGRNIGFSIALGALLSALLLAGIPLFMLSFAFGGPILASAGNYAVINRLEGYRSGDQKISPQESPYR